MIFVQLFSFDKCGTLVNRCSSAFPRQASTLVSTEVPCVKGRFLAALPPIHLSNCPEIGIRINGGVTGHNLAELGNLANLIE